MNEATPRVSNMSDEGTITPEVQLKEIQERLGEETDRLVKLYAAYEQQEKELLDKKAEIEVLEKEIVDREIEKESLQSLIMEKDHRNRELEMKASKFSKQVEFLEPELEKMEEKYAREKDRLGKVFGIAEELDNDLRLAVAEMKARDDWYVDHMSLFEDLNKAIKHRYELIESAVEAERQSQHMQRAITDRMDELVESRAAEMTIEEAENVSQAEKAASVEVTTGEAEETPEEEVPAEEAPKEEVPAEEAPKEETPSEGDGDDENGWSWSESVMERILENNSITDKDDFIEFAKAYDADNNQYLKASELERAAADWVAAHAPPAPPEEPANESWGDDVDPWNED